MKTELKARINEILNKDINDSIIQDISIIKNLREQIEDFLTDQERIGLNNALKDRIQREATEAWYLSGQRGAIANATGTGKSKIAVDLIKRKLLTNPRAKILLGVPTQNMRDVVWKDEFDKWGAGALWPLVRKECYVSFNNLEPQDWDLIVLDEYHHITFNSSEVFDRGKIHSCMALSATAPDDVYKKQILRSLKINVVYGLSTDQAVDLGLIPGYEITIITMHLDEVNKYLQGTKTNPELVTEKAKYNKLTARTYYSHNKFNYINRMQLIHSLRSKTEVAKLILQNVIPQDKRVIIFCGSKEQAMELCPYRYFSKPTYKRKEVKKETAIHAQKENDRLIKHNKAMSGFKGKEYLIKFQAEEISRLACVKALDEGENLSMLDIAFLVQGDSSKLVFNQRIGRTLRFRPNYVGKIIALVVANTVDETWINKATSKLDQTRIKRVELARLRLGLETIKFD